jgi:hypothetical protein
VFCNDCRLPCLFLSFSFFFSDGNSLLLKSVPITVLGDPNNIDPTPVRNQYGASVGDVIGNGLSFTQVSYLVPNTIVRQSKFLCHLFYQV